MCYQPWVHIAVHMVRNALRHIAPPTVVPYGGIVVTCPSGLARPILLIRQHAIYRPIRVTPGCCSCWGGI